MTPNTLQRYEVVSAYLNNQSEAEWQRMLKKLGLRRVMHGGSTLTMRQEDVVEAFNLIRQLSSQVQCPDALNEAFVTKAEEFLDRVLHGDGMCRLMPDVFGQIIVE
jgi:hypothetical protein